MNQTGLIIGGILVLVIIITFMSSKSSKKQREEAAKALADGMNFLKENGEKEGVIITDSGLQYEVIDEGEGPKPTIHSNVKTHYHGTLISGAVFDSSVDRGQPISFPLTNVIKGWQEGIQLMSAGAKYRFFIPPTLAYGSRGMGTIPANSTLIFEVELISF